MSKFIVALVIVACLIAEAQADCVSFITETSCKSDSTCSWFEMDDKYVCLSSDSKQKVCNLITEVNMCNLAASNGCSWANNVCTWKDTANGMMFNIVGVFMFILISVL